MEVNKVKISSPQPLGVGGKETGPPAKNRRQSAFRELNNPKKGEKATTIK